MRIAAAIAIAIGIGLAAALLLAPHPGALPPAIMAAPPPSIDTSPAARLFGKNEALTTQVVVAGIISGEESGAAVLKIDGGPAAAWRVGQEIAPGLVLIGVDANGIELERDSGKLRVSAPQSDAAVAGIRTLPDAR
ncbi:general secretion pathway protein GspC [Schauerella aestuarii]|uniref:general secretion pathway protein GspC n=1 Tax=Schauerella aestuarii TaxID=2511204 RepID=UPI00136C16DE|nr:general secretion pathway protein GspC [Achromobacter aestuarii]MYZ43394.1 general secretion pathway protein GspC [Achromobacter aestuarii]